MAVALLGALMCGMLAAWSLARALPQFSDPCHRWGVSFSAGAELNIPPGGPCRAISVTSETKAQAVARLVAINGGLLVAAFLGVLGIALARPRAAVLAAALLLLLSFPLAFSVAWVTALSAGLFLAAAREIAHFEGTAEPAARLVGLLAALAAVMFIPAVLAGVLFGLFSFAALAFAAAAGWWPAGTMASGSSHP